MTAAPESGSWGWVKEFSVYPEDGSDSGTTIYVDNGDLTVGAAKV